MIRKFIYTSVHLQGEVVLGYDSNNFDYLATLDLTKAELNVEQHATFLRHVPLSLSDLQLLVKEKPKERQYVEFVEDVTFKMFWDRYDSKKLSKKELCIKLWEKLSDAEKILAYNFILEYFKLIAKDGTAKKYAESYLRARLWAN